MFTHLKPYREYKDSGLPWLGQMPRHWETRKLKHVTQFLNGLPFKPGDWKAGGVPIIRIQNLNGSAAFNYTNHDDLPAALLIQPGDLMFAWSGNRGTSFGPFQWDRKFSGYLNQHIFKLVGYALPKRYFYYVLRAVTIHIEEQAGGIIGLVHVTKPELGSVRVPLAPSAEASAIAKYLDAATDGINRAIRAKKKLIALLNEQKQVIIHRAVTRGLDANAPLKPSGIPWLGDIPEQWRIMRLKHLAWLNPPKSGIPISQNEDFVTFLPMEHVSAQGEIDRSETIRVCNARDGFTYMRDGDVIVAKITPCFENGKGALCMGLHGGYGFGSTEFHVLRPGELLSGDYLYILTRDPILRQLGAESMQGSAGQKRVPREFFANLRVAFPPLSEQKKIVMHLNSELRKFNLAIARAQREIALLREYRIRLMADVVTGKLDVREAAKNLPAEAEEAPLELKTEELIEETTDEES